MKRIFHAGQSLNRLVNIAGWLPAHLSRRIGCVLLAGWVLAGNANADQKLTASDGTRVDFFGTSAAISGDTLVVAADNASVFGQPSAGAAYVFVRSGGIWREQAKLVASNVGAGNIFGWSVAISGDTIVIGQLRTRFDRLNSGSAHVFVRNGTIWSEQAKLTAPGGGGPDNFAFSVAISGDTIVVGSPGEDIGGALDQGAAYVFVRTGAIWRQQQMLVASDGAAEDLFGRSVAIESDIVVVGSPEDDVDANVDQGSAYVFVRNGDIWTEDAKLTALSGGAEDLFGSTSISISGDTIAIGAPFADVGANDLQGSTHIFIRSQGVWIRQAELTANDGAGADFFGRSVAILGDRLIVGAVTDDIHENTDQGSAYIFERTGGLWTQHRKLTASDGASGDAFGVSVAIGSESVAVGTLSDVGSNDNQGSVYVFDVNSPAPRRRAVRR